MFKLVTGVMAMVMLGAPTPTEVKTGPGTIYYDGPAPARYMQAGIVPLLLVDPADLNAICGVTPPVGLSLRGCTRQTKDGVSVIIMPMSSYPDNWFVLLHEYGHSRGWPGTHPL